MRCLRLAALCLFVSVLTACGSLPPLPYSADFAALDTLKNVPLQKASVGQFQPRDPSNPLNKISLRAKNLREPAGSFAQYLEAALIQDLREISAYDPGAAVRIDATILKNTLDISGFATGTGLMEVDLGVVRDGRSVLKKTYTASIEFESSFAGAIAIPKGQQEYGRLVRTLLGQIYADADFINALKK